MKVTGKNNYSIFLPVTGLQLAGNGPSELHKWYGKKTCVWQLTYNGLK